jgi:chemotaxis protein MotA
VITVLIVKIMALRTLEPSLEVTSPTDHTAVIGVALCTILVGLGAASSGSLLRYIDIPSFCLVLGGTLGATCIQHSALDLRRTLHAVKIALTDVPESPFNRTALLVRLSQAVRDNGLLALEQAAQRCDDQFLATGLRLAADGDELQDLRPILENEMNITADIAYRASGVLQTMGGYAPAMGLIGTLLGLIQMLGSLANPETVGPAMSLALVATLYGAIASNTIFLPLSGKLRSHSEEQTLVKRITIEGVVGLARQESPTVLSQRLQSYVVGFNTE